MLLGPIRTLCRLLNSVLRLLLNRRPVLVPLLLLLLLLLLLVVSCPGRWLLVLLPALLVGCICCGAH
jgi:hypothetical protein